MSANDCASCAKRQGDRCLAWDQAKAELQRPLPPPPTGACTIAIVESYESELKPGMRVLEIGCGSWSRLKDACTKVGATYEAIDPIREYFGIQTLATRIENLSDLSFESDTFDIVVGNQTMEHWRENGCSLEWGLFQIFRVLKPGGKAFINVPIHFHGSREFLDGQIEEITNLFSRFSNSVTLTTWGRNTAPLARYVPHPDDSYLRSRPAYVLDIRATAGTTKTLPKVSRNNALGFSERLMRLSTLPFHFLVTLAKRRILKLLTGRLQPKELAE